MTGKKTTKKETANETDEMNEPENDSQESQDLNPENPHGLYEDPRFSGPPASTFERFQRWSHRHKRAIYAAFFLAIILSFVVVMRGNSGSDPRDALSNYFGRFGGETEDWQYQIDRYYIGKMHLNNLYPVLAKLTYGDGGARSVLNDRDVYNSFVREQYETDLLAFAALQENTLANPEARMFLENSLRQAAADYYLYKQVGTNETDFRVNVSDAEALQYYDRNKAYYESTGLDKTAALGVIKNTLAGLRRDQMRQQLAIERSRVVAALKDRIGPRLNQE